MGGFGRHGSSEAVALGRQVLEQSNRPTALFVMADLQAFGCIAAAQALGLGVPDDVSIIGFDDIEVSAHVGLTTVRQHLTESGRVAARYLLSLLRGERAATLEALPTGRGRRSPHHEIILCKEGDQPETSPQEPKSETSKRQGGDST